MGLPRSVRMPPAVGNIRVDGAQRDFTAEDIERIKSEARALVEKQRAAEVPAYDPNEQLVLAEMFAMALRSCTVDGGEKRRAGTKPPWWRDPSHEAAIFSHLNAWKHGVLQDPDSGAHPLFHLAWRALALGIQETYGKRDPASGGVL